MARMDESFDFPQEDNFDCAPQKKETNDGLAYLVLLGIAAILIAFLFLVAGNVAGAIISSLLGVATWVK